tara:strand:+ start:319 stop:1191 length:873 start_codon:yes stop_codon:yes gene_type:complete
MITLLPFYREITDYDKEPIWVHNLKGFNYPLMLSQLYDTYARISIDKHTLPMKDVKFLVNTDEKTKFNTKFERVDILEDDDGNEYEKVIKRTFRNDVSDLSLIESKVVAETNAVNKVKGKLILCGVDHIIRRDVHLLFEIEKDFDIAVSVRKQKKVNNAIVLVNDRKPNLVKKFFKKRKNLYYEIKAKKDTGLKNWEWYGDQLVYDELFKEFRGPDKKYVLGKHKYNIDKINELTILIYPYGSEYVGTPDAFHYYRHAIIYDFKGQERKRHIQKGFHNLFGNTEIQPYFI